MYLHWRGGGRAGVRRCVSELMPVVVVVGRGGGGRYIPNLSHARQWEFVDIRVEERSVGKYVCTLNTSRLLPPMVAVWLVWRGRWWGMWSDVDGAHI